MTSSAVPASRSSHLLLTALTLLAGMLIGLLLTASRAAAEPAPTHGVWPLRPRPAVVEGFHPPASRFGAGHRGVDLAGGLGQPVHAALAGRVSFAGRLAGRGVVVVDHGATRTTFEPVAATVRVGMRVPAGGVLGRLQLFGSHCFPRACLHWGLIEGREHYLDPLTLVGAAPVRLLPLGVLGSGTAPSTPLPGMSSPPVAAVLGRVPQSWPSRASFGACDGKAPEGRRAVARRVTATQPACVPGGAQQATGLRDTP